MKPFGGFYHGQRVLITGHTGFKGAWLSLWLRELGAEVSGLSLPPPTSPALFDVLTWPDPRRDHRGDVLDFAAVQQVFQAESPEIVFHLAAQPLVRRAYEDPRGTLQTNILGTANVLEAARLCESVTTVVVVTSDKVYRNVEWDWAYRETDPLGGYEPYGVSKACAELIVGVYQDLRFLRATGGRTNLGVASARAGNVLGGGDWASHRIVPDLVRAIRTQTPVVLRHPHATRPWQHVLDALSGYLQLARRLTEHPTDFAGPWNFGPADEKEVTVAELARSFLARWGGNDSLLQLEPGADGEHRALRVDSSRARNRLGWRPAWSFEQTMAAVVSWYRAAERGQGAETARQQLAEYTAEAMQAGLSWAVRE